MHEMAFWVGKANAALACLLHAAALTGRTMTDVYQWAHGIDDAIDAKIPPKEAADWHDRYLPGAIRRLAPRIRGCEHR